MTASPPFIGWNEIPLIGRSRLCPFVRGFILSPASRSSGSATSAIDGSPGDSMRSIHSSFGLSATPGVGGASTMSASTCGGVWYPSASSASASVTKAGPNQAAPPSDSMAVDITIVRTTDARTKEVGATTNDRQVEGGIER